MGNYWEVDEVDLASGRLVVFSAKKLTPNVIEASITEQKAAYHNLRRKRGPSQSCSSRSSKMNQDKRRDERRGPMRDQS
jgi:hypothetical protein